MLDRVGCEKLPVKRKDRKEERDVCQGYEKRGRLKAALYLRVHRRWFVAEALEF